MGMKNKLYAVSSLQHNVHNVAYNFDMPIELLEIISKCTDMVSTKIDELIAKEEDNEK